MCFNLEHNSRLRTLGSLTLLNQEYMDPLYNTSTGHKLMIAGISMIAVGSLMLRKIVSFKG